MIESEPAGRFVVSLDEDRDGVVVLRLAGEADHSNSTSLTAAWLLVAMNMPERLVLECDQLRFVDSAVLTVVREIAGVVDLEIRGADPNIRRLLALAGVESSIAIG